MANTTASTKPGAASADSTNLNPELETLRQLIDLGLDPDRAWSSLRDDERQAAQARKQADRSAARQAETAMVFQAIPAMVKTMALDLLEVRSAFRTSDLEHDLAKVKAEIEAEQLRSEASIANARAHLALAKEFGLELAKDQLFDLVFTEFELSPAKVAGGLVASSETETTTQEADYRGNLKRTVVVRKEVYGEAVEAPEAGSRGGWDADEAAEAADRVKHSY